LSFVSHRNPCSKAQSCERSIARDRGIDPSPIRDDQICVELSRCDKLRDTIKLSSTETRPFRESSPESGSSTTRSMQERMAGREGGKKSFAVGLPRSLTHHEGLDFRMPVYARVTGCERPSNPPCATPKKQPSSNLRASEGLVPRRAH